MFFGVGWLAIHYRGLKTRKGKRERETEAKVFFFPSLRFSVFQLYSEYPFYPNKYCTVLFSNKEIYVIFLGSFGL